MQYRVEDEQGQPSYCTKDGVLDVAFQGMPSWLRVWFSTGAPDNAVSIEYSAPARQFLGAHIDPTFDNDLALWLATRPTPAWESAGGH